jgi:predicted CXXCH cytochrome family protein
MKKSILILALAAVLVLAFAAAASATSAKTWNYNQDYYSWGSWSGAGITSGGNPTLGMGGTSVVAQQNTNQTAGGGVHSNYQTTTAKCGICHSVHRAKAGGVKLLNTATATCAGCHISGTSTVTNVVIAWGTVAAPLAGPHGSTNGACNGRSCHAASPHGADGSVYGLFNAKLLNKAVDTAVAAAAADPTNSGVIAALLTGAGANTDFTGAADAVRVGYTCNQADCHVQTMLSVVEAGWAENRVVSRNGDGG